MYCISYPEIFKKTVFAYTYTCTCIAYGEASFVANCCDIISNSLPCLMNETLNLI